MPRFLKHWDLVLVIVHAWSHYHQHHFLLCFSFQFRCLRQQYPYTTKFSDKHQKKPSILLPSTPLKTILLRTPTTMKKRKQDRGLTCRRPLSTLILLLGCPLMRIENLTVLTQLQIQDLQCTKILSSQGLCQGSFNPRGHKPS